MPAACIYSSFWPSATHLPVIYCEVTRPTRRAGRSTGRGDRPATAPIDPVEAPTSADCTPEPDSHSLVSATTKKSAKRAASVLEAEAAMAKQGPAGAAAGPSGGKYDPQPGCFGGGCFGGGAAERAGGDAGARL